MISIKILTDVFNLIISKSATKYHYSSTMANGIGQSQKLGKQNRKQPGITNDPSNSTSSTSHIHAKFNEKNYIEVE